MSDVPFPRRWRPGTVDIGEDTYMVHPDGKVYRLQKKHPEDRTGPVRRVKDTNLAKFVHGRFIDGKKKEEAAAKRQETRLRNLLAKKSESEEMV